MTSLDDTAARRIATWVRDRQDEMTEFLRDIVLAESPTDVPESQLPVQKRLAEALEAVGLEVRHIPGRMTGGHLLATPPSREKGNRGQLLIGHTDTVWPIGTLEELPVEVSDGILTGPGSFDMKAGLTQIVFALRALHELGLEPALPPVVFVNSDEEIGSPESKQVVIRLARAVERAFILEPALGPTGRIKTARKGGGKFTITVTGKPAHAGLDPTAGASAILELSYVIQRLHGLTDHDRGVTVNVGVIDGGVRPNVVAPVSRAIVDVRVPTIEDARSIEAAIRSLTPSTPGVTLQVEGEIGLPPLERTPRNRALWEAARKVGSAFGLELEEAMAGGGSDGNTTSQYTATLDGLGAIGDGAHAKHEHVNIRGMVERCGLLAGLLVTNSGSPKQTM